MARKISSEYLGIKSKEKQALVPLDDGEQVFKLEKHLPKAASALPAIWCRTALFGMVKRGERALKEVVLMNRNGIKITAVGKQLNQQDLDVFLAIISMNNKTDNGVVKTSHSEIIRRIGLTKGGRAIAKVKASLVRLAGLNLTVEAESGGYFSGNILKVIGNEKTDYVLVKLDHEQSWIWQQATYINLGVRQSLKSDLSKWLQAYILSKPSSPRFPAHRSLVELQKECGSEIKNPREFKRSVKKAMDELKSNGVIEDWWFSGDKNHILNFAKSKRLDKKMKEIVNERQRAECKEMGIYVPTPEELRNGHY